MLSRNDLQNSAQESILVARFADALMLIYENTVFAVSASENWRTEEKSPECEKPAGNKEEVRR